ncbi:MAG: hypothetical protein JW896_01645 [Deltaproteobacteria bacterium]|nr:hypothetical protein [Deltaproteobacteria bacterium]
MNRSNHLLGFISTLVCLIFLGQSTHPLLAQDEETSLLQKRIDELELRIDQLEKQLEESMGFQEMLETGGFGWQNMMNWRKLEIGMPEDEVRSILGAPIKVIKGSRTLWYYPSIYKGFVSFDQNGNLAGWNEP